MERTLAWLSRCQRHSKDYEELPVTGEARVHIAMVHLMLRRLKPTLLRSVTHPLPPGGGFVGLPLREVPLPSPIGELRHDFGGEQLQRVQHLLMFNAAEVDKEYQVLGARIAQLADALGDMVRAAEEHHVIT